MKKSLTYIMGVRKNIVEKIVYKKIFLIIELADERKFTKKIVKIHKSLIKLEEQKYLEPLMSKNLEELAAYLRKNS